MKNKRNKSNKSNKSNIPLSKDGYIKKYFGTDIGRILMPGTRSLQNCEIPYVSHEEAEAVLKDSLVGDPLMKHSKSPSRAGETNRCKWR